jgi:hypothetical protein
VVGEELLALDRGEIGCDALARGVEDAGDQRIGLELVDRVQQGGRQRPSRRAFSDGAGVCAALDPVDARAQRRGDGQVRVCRASPPRSSTRAESGTRM